MVFFFQNDHKRHPMVYLWGVFVGWKFDSVLDLSLWLHSSFVQINTFFLYIWKDVQNRHFSHIIQQLLNKSDA